jgi:hypothetical protein
MKLWTGKVLQYSDEVVEIQIRKSILEETNPDRIHTLNTSEEK